MRTSVLPIVFSLALTLASGMAQAQVAGSSGILTASEAPPTILSRLFPHPTGNNGYEDWARAADLVQNDENVDAATPPEASLAFKRRILADPSASQALTLLREGLEKPIRSPQRHIDESTLFPELAMFRRLARLLCIEMHVDFVDGRVNAAIADLRAGLVYGYHIQTDTLISGLVGIAVDAIMLNEFAPHFDQLSASQCTQVLHIVEEGLDSESPATHLLTLERGYMLKMLDARRSDTDAMLALLDTLTTSDDGTGDPEETEALQNLQTRLIDHPEDLNPIIDEAKARTVALYNQAILNVRLPITQRKPLARDKAISPGYWLYRTITPDVQQLLNKYDMSQEQLRLLGVYALIRQYRLEHRALPTTLTQLHAADLVQDPFTGDPIVYQRNGDQYTLYSQGPLKFDSAGKAVSNERSPVKLKSNTH